MLYEACQEIVELERRKLVIEEQLKALARQMPNVEHLMSIPGVGLITATAMVGFVGNVARFNNGRQFANFLGLTPSERSSGLVRRLGRVSKRGDKYLRMLLVHGARAVLRAAKINSKSDGLRVWALQVEQRRGHNKAAMALANKTARIIWAIWNEARPYEPKPITA